MPEAIQRMIIKRRIKRAGGDFSVVMSRRSNSDDVVSILKYATKKANAEQRKLVSSK